MSTHLNIHDIYQQALRDHQAGKFVEVEQAYRQILSEDPDHWHAAHYLGVVLCQLNQLDESLELLLNAVEKNPQHTQALNHLGITYKRLGQHEKSLEVFARAIEINPQFVEAYNNLGNAQFSAAQYDAAVISYQKAIALRADYGSAYLGLSNAWGAQLKYEQALGALDELLKLDPQNVEGLSNKGLSLLSLKRYPEAIAALDQALAINPELSGCLLNKGNALKALNHFEAAIECYSKALECNSEYIEAYNNRGNAYKGLGKTQEAIDNYTRAIEINPTYADAHSNLGNSLCDLNQYDRATEAFRQALKSDPKSSVAYLNFGRHLHQLGEFDRAMKCYDLAHQLDPSDSLISWNRSMNWLMKGEYVKGWEAYEARWTSESLRASKVRAFDQPNWLGQFDIRDKTILLHAEQGLGDTLQFCRYVDLVLELGVKKIILEVQPPLLDILTHSLDPSIQLIARGQDIPSFDCHTALLSLPLAFKTTLDTIPDRSPYLFAPNKAKLEWQNKISKLDGQLNIGIVWSGSVGHKNDSHRSIPLERWKDILGINAQWHCLQKEIRDYDRQEVQGVSNIHLHDHELNDFSDTAALIEQMDLVISVDTSVAHLAAALGKSTWVLVAYSPDFRWLLGRNDSPWYPSARIYRQTELLDWSKCFQGLSLDLRNLAQGIEF